MIDRESGALLVGESSSSSGESDSESMAGVSSVSDGSDEDCFQIALTDISWRGCNMSDTDLVNRCAKELANVAVRCLDLSGNELEGPSLEQVANQLKQGSCVQILNLSENKIDEGIEHVCAFLPDLTNLDVSYNHLSAEGLSALLHEVGKSKCKLRCLNLRGNQIGEEGALLLAEAIDSNKHLRTTLRVLDVSDNALEHAGVAALLKAAASAQIESLSLDDSEPDLSTCVQDIAGSRVRKISLRCTGIDDDTACRLAQAIVLGFGECQELDLRDNKSCSSRGRTALLGVTKLKKNLLLKM